MNIFCMIGTVRPFEMFQGRCQDCPLPGPPRPELQAAELRWEGLQESHRQRPVPLVLNLLVLPK